MIALYFGLPGCGKSTLMAKMAYQASKKHSRYKNVYVNFPISVDGVQRIYWDDIGKYNLHDGLVLLDEASVGAISNRAYGNKGKKTDNDRIIEWFMMHRHASVDVILFTQRWDGVDASIRKGLLDRVYYIYKPFFTGWFRSKYYQIPYDIIIPDAKGGNGEKLGEIVQGYCKPGLFGRIFNGGTVYRPRYYKLFDSFYMPYMPELPEDRRFHKELIMPEKEKGQSRKKA